MAVHPEEGDVEMKRLFSAFCGALAMLALVFSASMALAQSKGKIY